MILVSSLWWECDIGDDCWLWCNSVVVVRLVVGSDMMKGMSVDGGDNVMKVMFGGDGDSMMKVMSGSSIVMV